MLKSAEGNGIQEKLLVHPTRQYSVFLKNQWQLFTLWLVVQDALLVGAAFGVAYAVRFNWQLPIFKLEARIDLPFYRQLSIIATLGWVLIFAIYGLYQRKNLLGGIKEYALLFNAVTVGMVGVMFAEFMLPDLVLARGWLLLSWFFGFFFVALGRFGLRRVIYALRKRGYFLTPAIIIGANPEGFSLAEQLRRWTTSGLQLIGFVDDELPSNARYVANLPALGTPDELDTLIARYHIEELILTSNALPREKVLRIFQRYGTSPNVHVRLSSGLYEIITTGLEVKEFAFVPLLGVNKVRLTGLDLVLKTLLDYSIAIGAIIIGAPILLLLALLVKLDSPGPVIYRRRVMGVNGKQFDAFKFRTMYVNGDEILARYPELQEELRRTHKLKFDPRVTRVGHYLRKASLDELPQLFNVLRGEMSIVGPRMISPPEMEMYAKYGLNLLTVKPGITGLWQVSGRSDVSWEQRVRFDMHYVRNWSIWLDLQILLQT
ncbi:MAG: sugar transferase, partial [Anaerolineae bacterium]